MTFRRILENILALIGIGVLLCLGYQFQEYVWKSPNVTTDVVRDKAIIAPAETGQELQLEDEELVRKITIILDNPKFDQEAKVDRIVVELLTVHPTLDFVIENGTNTQFRKDSQALVQSSNPDVRKLVGELRKFKAWKAPFDNVVQNQMRELDSLDARVSTPRPKNSGVGNPQEFDRLAPQIERLEERSRP